MAPSFLVNEAYQIGWQNSRLFPSRPHHCLMRLGIDSHQQQAGLLQEGELEVGLDGVQVENKGRRAAGPDGVNEILQGWVQGDDLQVGAVFQAGFHARQDEGISVHYDAPPVSVHGTSIAKTGRLYNVKSDRKTIVRALSKNYRCR